MIWHTGQKKINFSNKGMIMGILNVTPDSFSDSGLFLDPNKAVSQALTMIADGAEIIDIGGESTRPGAQPISHEEELNRTLPVIKALRPQTKALISIDTSKHEVAIQAIQAGADIINDVTGFTKPEMVEIAKNTTAGLICMHMQGTPSTMQNAPTYDNVLKEIRAFFVQQLALLTKSGIAPERICFDPGIGFGKRLEDNLAILNNLEQLRVDERPMLMGLSRKSFIAQLLEDDDLRHRDAPTVALTALMAQSGANIHRVHDVKENAQSLRMMEAILNISPKVTP